MSTINKFLKLFLLTNKWNHATFVFPLKEICRQKGASTDHVLRNNIGSGIRGQRMGCIVCIVFCSVVRDPVNNGGNLTNLIKRHLGQSGRSQCPNWA